MDDYVSHSKWECKYHVVFIPKYRRKTLYGELRQHLGEVFRKLAMQKESRAEAALSGPKPKAPGFAGGYLLGRDGQQARGTIELRNGLWIARSANREIRCCEPG